MSAEQESPAFAEFDHSAEVELTEVLALQSIVMGEVRRQAVQKGRRVRVSDNPRTRGYCVLRNSGDAILNGETDQLLTVRVRKLGNLGYRAWGMGISFLEYEQTEQGYLDNDRTVYQFRWDEEAAYGRKQQLSAIGKVKLYDVQPSGMKVFPAAESVGRVIYSPVIPEELDVIADRALEVAFAATPRLHHLIDRLVEEKLGSAA
jgi:hypothetical protein